MYTKDSTFILKTQNVLLKTQLFKTRKLENSNLKLNMMQDSKHLFLKSKIAN